MAHEKITEDELLGRIRNEITDALGYDDEISKQREMAMEYYYGQPFGNEVEGRSQFVDSTVQDTIEWIKPSLMRVFASGDEMVKFNPHGPEDVPMAKQIMSLQKIIRAGKFFTLGSQTHCYLRME